MGVEARVILSTTVNGYRVHTFCCPKDSRDEPDNFITHFNGPKEYLWTDLWHRNEDEARRSHHVIVWTITQALRGDKS